MHVLIASYVCCCRESNVVSRDFVKLFDCTSHMYGDTTSSTGSTSTGSTTSTTSTSSTTTKNKSAQAMHSSSHRRWEKELYIGPKKSYTDDNTRVEKLNRIFLPSRRRLGQQRIAVKPQPQKCPS